MVLQREKPIIIWGWANPGEFVHVTLSTASQDVRANANGEWKATLPAMKAGGPFTLQVSGSSAIKYHDIKIGEVWLCSGQSNMEMGIGRVTNAASEISAAHYPDIRLLMVSNRWSGSPETNIEGQWKICSPQTVTEGGWQGFSAVAYFFARNLYQTLKIPIGVIDATWGGTRIESWTPPEGFAAVPELSHDYQRVQLADPRTALHQKHFSQFLDTVNDWVAEARKDDRTRTPVPPMPSFPDELRPPHQLQQATALYNGMINPLIPFSIRGVIWYQGEQNLSDGSIYKNRMQALVHGWRSVWGEGNFPFYFVQVAPFNYGGDPEAEPLLWEAQSGAAKSIPNADMVVINDIGNLKDIHPRNKQEVGRRLALMALSKTYGQKGIVANGPEFKSMDIEGDEIRVRFDHVAGGLASRNGKPLDWFEIIDANKGGFVKANAQIEGDSVLLSSPKVKHPVAMRYAWSMFAEPNLVNSAGLPASAFRAGKIPKRDLLAMKIPEAGEYQLVYDLDLKKLGHDIHYQVDHHAEIHQPFDRIAYFIELQHYSGYTEYLFVSMDAFTKDLGKIGIPTAGSGAFFQQNVTNMDVFCNNRSITCGRGLTGGNIEFWPNNYTKSNSDHIPNASGIVYDFGDKPGVPVDGYGCMQVHNHDAQQTLFAVNHWTAGGYKAMRLRVLVRCR